MVLLCVFGPAGCEDWIPPLEQHYTTVDVYTDRYEYRYEEYTSPRALGIAIEAAQDPVETLNLRECVSGERLAEVIGVLRARGERNFAIVQPPVAC